MKKFKRFIRRCGYVLFLILACTGVAICGAAPVPSKRQEDFTDQEILIEMIDKKEESAENATKDVLL